jgi:SAM-dependent methyltransferase
MPTIAPEPHQNRDLAESFGGVAQEYDRTRPSYPDALIAAIVAAAPGPEILDVGCGTGISSRQFEAAGCAVLGVEVDPRMADLARQRGSTVEVSAFESWEAGGRTFDAVVAGQTWHWIDPVAGASKARSLLRPGGVLAPFWNVLRPPAALAEAGAAFYRRVLPDLPMLHTVQPDIYDGMFRTAEDGIRTAGGFAEPRRWQFDWEHTYTRDEWLAVVPTQGIHTRLPASVLDELLAEIGAAVDAMGGSFVARYAAVALTASAR